LILLTQGSQILDERERESYEDAKKDKNRGELKKPKKSFKEMTAAEYESYLQSQKV